MEREKCLRMAIRRLVIGRERKKNRQEGEINNGKGELRINKKYILKCIDNREIRKLEIVKKRCKNKYNRQKSNNSQKKKKKRKGRQYENPQQPPRIKKKKKKITSNRPKKRERKNNNRQITLQNNYPADNKRGRGETNRRRGGFRCRRGRGRTRGPDRRGVWLLPPSLSRTN